MYVCIPIDFICLVYTQKVLLWIYMYNTKDEVNTDFDMEWIKLVISWVKVVKWNNLNVLHNTWVIINNIHPNTITADTLSHVYNSYVHNALCQAVVHKNTAPATPQGKGSLLEWYFTKLNR